MNNSRRCNRGASTITKQLALQERFYSLCCSALLFGTIIFSTTNNNFIKLNKTSQFLKFNWSNFLPGAYSKYLVYLVYQGIPGILSIYIYQYTGIRVYIYPGKCIYIYIYIKLYIYIHIYNTGTYRYEYRSQIIRDE